jgi:peptide/nickel transport system substrate-binding protein/oligopeptide transport system substrate-binding protein
MAFSTRIGRRAAGALLLVLLAGCSARVDLEVYPAGSNAGGPPRMGGTAVLVREEDPDYLDPALSYGTYSAPVTEAIFHTLLDYEGVPGPAGALMRPDLAESLPDIRENGTLYAFKVRADARFSAPLPRKITAADFKYSIERLFAVNSPGVPFFSAIVGAEDVLAGRGTELRGVIARGDCLYVRIREPDPVFLQILTMTFTSPVPREVADAHPNDFSQHTVASGPFMVADFVPRVRVLLVRNAEYCGPPAWLDTIEVRLGVSTANAVAMIRRGLAHGGFFEVPASEVGRIRRDPFWRHQIDVADGLNTTYLFMNVQQPPFNDVRVRQAVNWALDRRAFVKIYAGKAIPAHEFLPLGMPGVEPLHMYEGPDLERARALLAEAGHPDGFTTKLYGYTAEPTPREVAVVQQQLAQVGITCELDLGEAVGYTSMAGDTSRRIPFGYYAWTADYVDPSNFIDVLLNGLRITPKNNLNLSLFNDPDINAMIYAATREQDDAKRIAMWNRIDRVIMDRAPIAPLHHQLESRLYGPALGGWYRHITRILKLEQLYLKQPAGAAPREARTGRRVLTRAAGAP